MRKNTQALQQKLENEEKQSLFWLILDFNGNFLIWNLAYW